MSQKTYLMNDPAIEFAVHHIIDMLRTIDVDGETMEYILEQVGMEDQMHRQLSSKEIES